MSSDKLIYTDGHSVVVTDATLKVKNTQYTLKGITRYGLSILQPARLPALLLIGAGIIFVLLGIFNLVPVALVPPVRLRNLNVDANTLVLWLGVVLATIGLNVNLMLKKRYSVRIVTATGEKDVIVSYEREYISQIVSALDQASSPLSTTYLK